MNLKTIKKGFLVLLLLLISSNLAMASNFTPERPSIEFKQGEYGFSYPSFNNFKFQIGGERKASIPGPVRENDERKFLIAQKCGTSIASCEGLTGLSNNVQNLKEGDWIQFELYFHNNGEDDYDGDSTKGSPNAKNAKIGLDIGNLINPKGFIYADNNEYRTNRNDITTTINYKNTDYKYPPSAINGTPAKTASDDVTLSYISNDLYLKLNKGAYLYMAYDKRNPDNDGINNDDGLNTFFASQIKPTDGKKDLKFYKHGKYEEFITKVSFNDTQDLKKWIEFDQLPGCYRYSGVAYFYAKVEKRQSMPMCNEMTLNHSNTFQLNGVTTYELKTVINMSDDKMPPNSYLHILSDDKDAKLFTKTGTTYTPISRTGQGTDSSTFKLNTTNLSNTIYYQGKEEMTVIPKNNNEYIFAQVCFVEFLPPQIPPDCIILEAGSRKLPTKYQNQDIYELKVSNLTFAPPGKPEGTKIRWTITSGTGQLYLNTSSTSTPAYTRVSSPYTDILAIPETLYFTGFGTITIEALDKDSKLWTKCKTTLTFTPPETPIECTELKMNSTTLANKLEEKPIHELTLLGPKFSPDGTATPAGTNIRWTVQTGEGRFYTRNSQGSYVLMTSNLQAPTQKIFFVGYGVIKAETLKPNNTIWTNCNATLTFTPPETPIECTELKMNSTTLANKLEEKPIHELTLLGPKFSPDGTEIPTGTNIRWTVQAGEGKFYTRNLTGNYELMTPNIQAPTKKIFFVGYGTVKAETLKPDNTIWTNCNATLTFTPPETPICEEILVNYSSPVEEETQTRFASKSIDTKNQNFNEQITYKVDSGFGFFSETKCEGLKDNPNPQITEFQNATAKVLTSPIKKQTLQANTLIALSPDQREKLLNQKVFSSPKSLNQQLIKGDLQLQKTPSYNVEKLEETESTTRIPIQPLQLACNGKTELTVDAGKEVFFYALKPSNGQNVIHITTNNTNVPDCEKHLPIGPKPPTPEMPACIDLSLISSQETINGKAGIKLTPTHVFSPIYVANVETLPLVYTNWTTTDVLGKFFTKSENTFIDQGTSYKQNALILTTPDGRKYYQFEAVYYQGENPLTNRVEIEAKTYDANNNLFFPCVQKVVLNPAPEMPVCLSLETYDYTDPENPTVLQTLESDSYYIITNDTEYTSTPEETKTTYTSSEGVFIAIPNFPRNDANNPDFLSANILINTYLLIAEDIIKSGLTRSSANQANLRETITVDDGQFVVFLTYKDAEENPNALTVRATNRTETECIKSYPLLLDLVCLDLLVIDWTTSTNPRELSSPLKENSYYELGTNLYLSKDIEGQVKYTSDSGIFLVVPKQERALSENYLSRSILEDTYRQIAIDLVESELSIADKGTLSQEIIVDSDQTVFFITFVDASTTTNALRVEYAEGGFIVCIQNYSLEKTPPPPVIKECLELNIIRPSGEWDFDDLALNGSQKFELEVITNPESYKEEIEYKWTIRPSYAGTWEDGNTTDIPENILESFDEADEPRAVIQAYDKNTNLDLPYCRAEIDYEYEEIPPEIEKYVYDKKGKSFKKLINIGGKATDEQASWLSSWLDKDFQFVNYLIEFTPGSAKSAEIYEKYLEDGAIEGNLNGKLNYLEMAVLVEPKGNRKPYTIFVSEGFDEDRYLNEKIGSEKITDHTDFETSIQNLERKYSCEEANSSVVCIANDYDDIEKDFRNGKKIILSNLQNAERVYFVIQTENHTVINDDKCKELTTVEGCGEVFDNKIHFEGSRRPLGDDFDLQDSVYDGNDDAKVIVICPFIITRGGGDVFFRDVLDTGIDVNVCSEVKGGELVVKEREDKPIAPQTGAGDEETIIFKLPTHDICKLSNTEDSELEEYRNVLKNFSSSICEMEAEVSALWKEENINKSIIANIDKIARFGKISGNITLNTQNELSLKGFGNISSGVFVIDGGSLTIGDGVNPYRISKSGDIPAYQTYIVLNGDINIKSNVIYDDSAVNPSDPKSFPSVAFIVVNGNINISNSVNEINGILMATSGENEDSGQIKSFEKRPTYDTLLTVNGSLIGDVYDLFFNRRAIGDPLKDQGSITVRYDQRVLLNTPEGLNQLIDVRQLRTAN